MEEQQVEETTVGNAVDDQEGITNDDLEETEAETTEAEAEAETFPRSYVEELRQENGKYRQRAQRTDDLVSCARNSLSNCRLGGWRNGAGR